MPSANPGMPSTYAQQAVEAIELLKKQHKAYFPIVNDPHLLAEYALDFFGPDGTDPLFTQQTALDARSLLQNRCAIWSRSREAQGKKHGFVEEEADYGSISEEDLRVKVNLILQVIEDPENLLGYISKVFGPSGPEGLAITDETAWTELDDLFLCRMHYPSDFPESETQPAKPTSNGLYRHSYAKGEAVEAIIVAPVHLPAISTAPVIEPEVLPPPGTTPNAATKPVSAMEIAGWCALGAGAVLLGGVAIKSLGRFLASPAGAALADEFATAAFKGLTAAARPVFVGPRGGKYTVTANGTKSYNVP